jgi:hypothetical protein
LIIIAATFTVGLLKTSDDTNHRWFVLRTVGEMIFTAGSCYEPLVKIWAINVITADWAGLCFQLVMMADPILLPVLRYQPVVKIISLSVRNANRQ